MSLELIKVSELDDNFERVELTSLSDYDKKNPNKLPTHYTLELRSEGRWKGFDKVSYYRKK